MSIKEKHKLSLPWEGPYTVTEVIQPGAYRLKDNNGNVLTNTDHQTVTSFLSLKLGLTAYFHSTFAPIAPQPEHSWPGSLGGSTGVRHHPPILLSCSNTFCPNERASPKQKVIPFL